MSHPIYNPMIPYTGIIPGFSPGQMLRIQGSIHPNADRLTISLMCGPNVTQDDISLQLLAKFYENAVTQNSRVYLNWGPEERKNHLPLSRGQPFEIIILLEHQQYKVAFNGHHFTEYEHRLPIERMTHLFVDGDINVTLIQFEGGQMSGFVPSAPLMMPESGPMPPYPTSSSMGQPMPQIGWAPDQPVPTGAGIAPPPYGYSNYPPAHSYPPQPMYPASQPQGTHGGFGEAEHQQSGGKGPGKMVANQLEKLGYGGLAKKIPGSGSKKESHFQSYPQNYPQPQGGYQYPPQNYAPADNGHDQKSGHSTGALVGTAAAAGLGGVVAAKALKKGKKKKKIIKYGVPIAGVALGAYAVKKILD